MNSIVSAFFPLLILLVIIFLYVIGFKRFKQNNGIEGTGPNGESPYGVFGVLGFFVFSSYYIAPLYVFGNTAKNLQKVELDYPAILELPGYGTYKICVYLLVFGNLRLQ
jgi:sorbitol-specific phosphotransferase system component IIC